MEGDDRPHIHFLVAISTRLTYYTSMTNTSSNDECERPTDAELEAMVKKMLDDIFGGDISDSETPDDPNWTVDKETAKSDFPEEAN